MSLVLVAEIPQRAEHRIRRRLPQSAHARVGHGPAELLDEIQVRERTPALCDVVEDLPHPLRALTARVALPARLVFEKPHEVPGHIHHARAFVHDDHATRAHDGTGIFQAVVVDREIEEPIRNASTGWSPDLHCLDPAARQRTASDVVDYFLDGGTHRHLDQARVRDPSHDRENFGPLAGRRSDAGVFVSSLGDDDGDVRPGLHVVDAGGPAVYAPLCGKGRSLSRLAHRALDGANQGGLLAAHERSGALYDVDIEVKPRTQDVLPEESVFTGQSESDQHMLDG